jgi:hypothetical protein
LKINGRRIELELQNLFVVYLVEFNSKNYFTIDFWEPLSNGHIKLLVKKMKGKVEINTIEEGSF